MIKNLCKNFLNTKNLIASKNNNLSNFSTKLAPEKERLEDWEYVQRISKEIKSNDISEALSLLIQVKIRWFRVISTIKSLISKFTTVSMIKWNKYQQLEAIMKFCTNYIVNISNQILWRNFLFHLGWTGWDVFQKHKMLIYPTL